MNSELAATFTRIYNDKIWGSAEGAQSPFFSGDGSHNPLVLSHYLSAMLTLLRFFQLYAGRKPNVVDLGCGDFFVGAQLREHCAQYTACDIVAPLVEYNRTAYAHLNVDFRVVDITRDELPAGDIVTIRQVLQHLSNEDIASVLPSLRSQFQLLVLTEHVPIGAFVPNLNKPSDEHNRLNLNSGVVLTSPPFNLPIADEFVIATAPEAGGIVHTVAYRIA
ncbi:MAG TPA: class I SAM-dependent methyltransferase [Caulobacteraceae bacterium]|nr:class I SAM-dependent methyltransferase [Caulobacteraceae bacterium]